MLFQIDLVKQTPSETQQVKNNGVDDRVSEKKDYWLKVKRTLLEKKQDGLEGNSNMAFSLDQADNVEGWCSWIAFIFNLMITFL